MVQGDSEPFSLTTTWQTSREDRTADECSEKKKQHASKCTVEVQLVQANTNLIKKAIKGMTNYSNQICRETHSVKTFGIMKPSSPISSPCAHVSQQTEMFSTQLVPP